MNRSIFSPSDATSAPTDRHHASAAAMNSAVVTAALGELADAIAAESKTERILLRAAAGAGKSHSLVTMVQYALGPGGATRVAVTAFQNRQVQPLAKRLAGLLGKDAVVLLASRSADVPQDVLETVNVVRKVSDIEGGSLTRFPGHLS